jgi:hypothetical protein
MNALARMARVYYWAAAETPGLEHCRLDTDPADDCYVAHGTVMGVERDGRNKGKPYRLTYKVKADAGWRTRKVTLESQGQDGSNVTRILRSDGKGNWKDERGDALEPAKGCLDIDIWATPFTNTLPIRRLAQKPGGLKPGQRETIRALWVTGPDLRFRTVAQHYTLLPSGRVLYEDGEADFRAELALDADGVVTDYPGLFRRL